MPLVYVLDGMFLLRQDLKIYGDIRLKNDVFFKCSHVTFQLRETSHGSYCFGWTFFPPSVFLEQAQDLKSLELSERNLELLNTQWTSMVRQEADLMKTRASA